MPPVILSTKAQASYWHGWNPHTGTSADITSAQGVPPLQLLDEPESPSPLDDPEGYAKALLQTLIAQTKATPRNVPVCANIEYIWEMPQKLKTAPKAEKLAYIRKVAPLIQGVIRDWRNACGPREGGYGAYGLYVPDHWGFALDDGVFERNQAVALACGSLLDWVEVDLYFRQLVLKQPLPGEFLTRHAYSSARTARLLYPGKKIRGWVSQELVDPVTDRNVDLRIFEDALWKIKPLVDRGLIDVLCHYAGWPLPALNDTDGEKRFIRSFKAAMGI